MNNSIQLANRFREVVLNGTWIANTNYKDQLTTLDWKTATTTFQSLNSIAALAQHVHYYIAGIKKVLSGGALEIKDIYSFDFPTIESAEQWESFLGRFWKDAEEFAALVESLPEQKLQEDFVDPKYNTFQRNIDGMTEHCYYHLGQIVMLRKILSRDL